MAAWKKGKRHESWASNPNIAIYIFFLLLALWLGFQLYNDLGGPPAPDLLDRAVMLSLGVAITTKSVESGKQRKELEDKVDRQEQKTNKQGEKLDALQDVAKSEHPDRVDEYTPPLDAKESEDEK